MLFHEQPTEPWTEYDFKILEAYQILQDEICSQCGNPVWLCHSTDNRVEFKAIKSTCFATKQHMIAEDNKKKPADRADSKERATWGQTTYMKPYIVQNAEGDLPTRWDYYNSLTVE